MDTNIFSAESPLGYVVVCPEETWVHMSDHNHNMMADNKNAIKNAISNPIAIFNSQEHPDKRHVYFGRYKGATYTDKLVTKVIVDKPDEYNSEGVIVTAWPQEKINGNISQGGLVYVNIGSR